MKAAGRFVYIDRVKNPKFLRYPRVLRYVKRNLQHYPGSPLRKPHAVCAGTQ